MSWEVVRIDSAKAAKRRDFITISGGKINFTTEFVHTNKLSNFKYVTYLVDVENHRIGFKFFEDNQEGQCVKIDWRKRDTPSGRIGLDPLRKFKFIADVEKSKDVGSRRFIPFREHAGANGEIWVIQLAPSFEHSVAVEDLSSIPIDATGIYRYLKEGRVIYIGKGDVRRRAQSPERQHWEFDTIQYSNIQRVDQSEQNREQFRWERYWILRFKDENGGVRPIYNKNDGIEAETDPI